MGPKLGLRPKLRRVRAQGLGLALELGQGLQLTLVLGKGLELKLGLVQQLKVGLFCVCAKAGAGSGARA